MTRLQIYCLPPDPALFAPYGTFVLPPREPGQRAFYSRHLGAPGLVNHALHTNHIHPSKLPLTVTRIERHPYADQVFVPLDVARYIVAVMPSDPSGNPIPEQTLAFQVPGSIGVIFGAGTWHLGATVLDRAGSFAVFMHRRGDDSDDEFRQIDTLTLRSKVLAPDLSAESRKNPAVTAMKYTV